MRRTFLNALIVASLLGSAPSHAWQSPSTSEAALADGARFDPSCIFCKIVAGDIPAEVLGRTEHALAFRIGPVPRNAAADQAPRHRADTLRIEPAKIDDIDGHAISYHATRACISLRPECRVNPSPAAC